jgi:hypothetical protein
MDNPLPVNRVMPPRAICITVIPTPISNQVATCLEDLSVAPIKLVLTEEIQMYNNANLYFD